MTTPDDPAAAAAARIGDILATAEREVAQIVAAAERRTTSDEQARAAALDDRAAQLDRRQADLDARELELAARRRVLDARQRDLDVRAAEVAARNVELTEIAAEFLAGALAAQTQARRLSDLPPLSAPDPAAQSAAAGGAAPGPAEVGGAEARSAEVRSAEARGAEARGAEARGAEARGATARGAEARSAEATPGEPGPGEPPRMSSWRSARPSSARRRNDDDDDRPDTTPRTHSGRRAYGPLPPDPPVSEDAPRPSTPAALRIVGPAEGGEATGANDLRGAGPGDGAVGDSRGDAFVAAGRGGEDVGAGGVARPGGEDAVAGGVAGPSGQDVGGVAGPSGQDVGGVAGPSGQDVGAGGAVDDAVLPPARGDDASHLARNADSDVTVDLGAAVAAECSGEDVAISTGTVAAGGVEGARDSADLDGARIDDEGLDGARGDDAGAASAGARAGTGPDPGDGPEWRDVLGSDDPPDSERPNRRDVLLPRRGGQDESASPGVDDETDEHGGAAADHPDKIDSARLVALSMAAEGRSREDVESIVRGKLGIRDHEALLDYVFGTSTPSSIVPSWPPRRRRRPS